MPYDIDDWTEMIPPVEPVSPTFPVKFTIANNALLIRGSDAYKFFQILLFSSYKEIKTDKTEHRQLQYT